jgi:hypothetical protein
MALRHLNILAASSLMAGTLMGCNSTESVLQPVPTATQPTPSVTQPTNQGILVSFPPVTGAPADKLNVLSQTLAQETRNNGITIVSTTNAEAQYSLKGFLSAFSDNANTTVVYVWDILDPSGARLYRIQGQKDTPGAGADPWQFVTPAVMQAIASESIANFLNWQRQQS